MHMHNLHSSMLQSRACPHCAANLGGASACDHRRGWGVQVGWRWPSFCAAAVTCMMWRARPVSSNPSALLLQQPSTTWSKTHGCTLAVLVILHCFVRNMPYHWQLPLPLPLFASSQDIEQMVSHNVQCCWSRPGTGSPACACFVLDNVDVYGSDKQSHLWGLRFRGALPPPPPPAWVGHTYTSWHLVPALGLECSPVFAHLPQNSVL